MNFEAKLWKDGKHWLIEAPVLDLMTQGRTKADACAMLKEAIELLADRTDLVNVRVTSAGVSVEALDTGALIALALRRQRQKRGLSLAEVTKRLGQTSRNAYARFDQGPSVPSVEKLEELFRAVAPDAPLVLRVA